MNKFNLFALSLLVVSAVSGCGPRMVWVNQNPDRQSSFYIDNGECENEARRLYPSVQLPPPPPPPSSSTYQYESGTVDVTDQYGNRYSGNYYGNNYRYKQKSFEEQLYERQVRERYIESGAIEARNDKMRREAYKQCMDSRGWYQTTNDTSGVSRKAEIEQLKKDIERNKRYREEDQKKKKKKRGIIVPKSVLGEDAWWIN